MSLFSLIIVGVVLLLLLLLLLLVVLLCVVIMQNGTKEDSASTDKSVGVGFDLGFELEMLLTCELSGATTACGFRAIYRPYLQAARLLV
jgi:hypothetical protein